MKRFLIIAFLLISVNAFAYTETFYVCEGGDGTLPETATCATAWDGANFNSAGNWDTDDQDDGKIGPNDVVYIMDDGGTHNGTLISRGSGTSGNHITIMAQPGDSPVIDAKGEPNAIFIGSKAYLDISGIVFQNSTGNVCSVRTSTSTDCHDISFTDCEFNNAGSRGVNVSTYIDYPDNTTYNISFTDCSASDNQKDGFNITGYWNTHDITLTRCTAADNNAGRGNHNSISTSSLGEYLSTGWTQHAGNIYYHATGIDRNPEIVVNQSDYNILDENDGNYGSLSEDEWDYCPAATCGTDRLYINIGEDPDGSDIRVMYGRTEGVNFIECKVTGGLTETNHQEGIAYMIDHATKGVLIDRCVAYGMEGKAVSIRSSSNVTIRNSLFYGNNIDDEQGLLRGVAVWEESSNINIYNNTFCTDANDVAGVIAMRNRADTVNIKNNIIVDGYYSVVDEANNCTNITEDYNQFYSQATAERFNVSAGSNSQMGDPKFTNSSSNDYTLRPDSPCIDEGENLGANHVDALHPDSIWPSGVLKLDQNRYGRAWEIGAYVYKLGIKIPNGLRVVQLVTY